jgi:hypothetical protein
VDVLQARRTGQDQVLSIDEQEFIYKDEDGEESTMMRSMQ